MKIFRNRTVIGVLCILLALIICFGLTPMFSRSASEKAEIVRVTADIKEGDEITAEMVQTMEVGAYNLPQNIMTDKNEVIGKYATADLKVVSHAGRYHSRSDGHRCLHRRCVRVLCLCSEADPAH